MGPKTFSKVSTLEWKTFKRWIFFFHSLSHFEVKNSAMLQSGWIRDQCKDKSLIKPKRPCFQRQLSSTESAETLVLLLMRTLSARMELFSDQAVQERNMYLTVGYSMVLRFKTTSWASIPVWVGRESSNHEYFNKMKSSKTCTINKKKTKKAMTQKVKWIKLSTSWKFEGLILLLTIETTIPSITSPKVNEAFANE